MMPEKNKEDIDLEYLEMMINNFNWAIENELKYVYMGYEIKDDYEYKVVLYQQYQLAKKEKELEKLKDVTYGTMCGDDFSTDKFALQVITNYPDLFEYWLKNNICDKFEVVEYYQDYNLPINEWDRLIDLLIEGAIQLEEYEICIKLKNLKKLYKDENYGKE